MVTTSVSIHNISFSNIQHSHYKVCSDKPLEIKRFTPIIAVQVYKVIGINQGEHFIVNAPNHFYVWNLTLIYED